VIRSAPVAVDHDQPAQVSLTLPARDLRLLRRALARHRRPWMGMRLTGALSGDRGPDTARRFRIRFVR
jgi:hypothetical protein